MARLQENRYENFKKTEVTLNGSDAQCRDKLTGYSFRWFGRHRFSVTHHLARPRAGLRRLWQKSKQASGGLCFYLRIRGERMERLIQHHEDININPINWGPHGCQLIHDVKWRNFLTNEPGGPRFGDSLKSNQDLRA